MTEPSDPSAGAVLETALAQICHDGLSMTVANADICPADQSLHTWAPVHTKKCSKSLFAENRDVKTTSIMGKDGQTSSGMGKCCCKHGGTGARGKRVDAMMFNFRKRATSENRVVI